MICLTYVAGSVDLGVGGAEGLLVDKGSSC